MRPATGVGFPGRISHIHCVRNNISDMIQTHVQLSYTVYIRNSILHHSHVAAANYIVNHKPLCKFIFISPFATFKLFQWPLVVSLSLTVCVYCVFESGDFIFMWEGMYESQRGKKKPGSPCPCSRFIKVKCSYRTQLKLLCQHLWEVIILIYLNYILKIKAVGTY